MTTLHLDYETYSEHDLRKAGLDVYSRDCEVLMCAWSFDDGPIQHWTLDNGSFPREVADALADPRVIKWAFNSQFERTITRRALRIKTPIASWRCTQTLAYMLSFSGGLADVGAQIGLPEDTQKMKEGPKLIRLFCMPNRITKNQPLRRRDSMTDHAAWERFCAYNIGDVRTETAILRRLSRYPVPESEWALYHLDQRINDRGMPVDVEFCEQAIVMAGRRTAEHVGELRRITGLANPNSTPQFLPWLRDRGYPFADLQKATVQKVLTEDEEITGGIVTREARAALKLRQWAARISTRKFGSVLRALGPDGFIRFLFQFAGASRTNRWAGRRVQTQNLPRTPKLLLSLPPFEPHELLSLVTDLIRFGDYDGLTLYAPEPLEAIVGATRGMFRAPLGYLFVVCDLSSIESRVIAWLAECIRLMQVFRDGRDPYIDFGTTLYDVEYEDVTKQQRQDSKPAVLGAGFGLGGGELKEGKRTGLWGYAESMGVNLTQEAAADAVEVFRETYPEIPELWYALERAAVACIKLQRPRTVGVVRFEWCKPFLVCVLPSGRRMYYYKPRLHKLQLVSKRTGNPYEKIAITYYGQDQKTGQWKRLSAHGAKFVENIVQAIARDALAEGITRAMAAGLDVRGHVHDEIILLARENEAAGQLVKLRELMVEPMPWWPDLLLDAAGYAAPFYRKD